MYLDKKSKNEIDAFINNSIKSVAGVLVSKESNTTEYNVIFEKNGVGEAFNKIALIYNNPSWNSSINLSQAIALKETGDDLFSIEHRRFGLNNMSISDVAEIRLLLNTVNCLNPNWFCKYMFRRTK